MCEMILFVAMQMTPYFADVLIPWKGDKGQRFWSFSTTRNFDCTRCNFICTTCNFSTKFCEPHPRCNNRCIISDLSCIFFFGQNLAVNSSGDQTLFPWKATHRYIVLYVSVWLTEAEWSSIPPLVFECGNPTCNYSFILGILFFWIFGFYRSKLAIWLLLLRMVII